MSTLFADFITEVELRCNAKELAMLEEARERCRQQVKHIERCIERREAIEDFKTVLTTLYGDVTHHVKDDPFDRDGDCLEVTAYGVRFTTLLERNEVWAERDGERVTPEPVQVDGRDEVVINNIIKYIDSFR